MLPNNTLPSACLCSNLPECLWIAWQGSSESFYEGAWCIHRQSDTAHTKMYLRTSGHLERQQALAGQHRHPKRDTWTPMKKYPAWSKLSQRERQESTLCHCRVPTSRGKRGSAQWVNTSSLNEPISYKLFAICTWVAFRLLEFNYPHKYCT